jgi:hypothetical protein
MQNSSRTVDAYCLGRLHTTPLPHVVLEAALTLPEAQARLLLLVSRQTLGFTAGPGKRRAVARLSHAQIGVRIGRSSTAISQAIESLVSQGYLEVVDAEGRLLATGRARQLQRAPLCFRLPRAWIEAGDKPVDNHGPAK